MKSRDYSDNAGQACGLEFHGMIISSGFFVWNRPSPLFMKVFRRSKPTMVEVVANVSFFGAPRSVGSQLTMEFSRTCLAEIKLPECESAQHIILFRFDEYRIIPTSSGQHCYN